MTETKMADGTQPLRFACPRRSPAVIVRRCRPLFFAAFLLCAAAFPGSASLLLASLDARIVWLRGERAYIASRDSLVLTPFSLLTFTSRGKTLAVGEVERVIDGTMAVARITSGSLAKVKDLRRVHILAERPDGPPRLRVGYPSAKRSSLLFSCDRMILDPPLAPGTFRLESENASYRLMRNAEVRDQSLWPETLLVRLFDDAADQEIALERGELDVAVFWPGELSTPMREDPRWKDRLPSPRKRGILAAIWLGSDSIKTRCATALAESRAFEALNQRLFRGDLVVPWDVATWCGDTTPARPARPVRYEVDPSCPGHVVLERFLNRDAPSGHAADATPAVHVFYLDSRGRPDEIISAAVEHIRRGSFPPALRARADSLGAAIGRGEGTDGPWDPGWLTGAAYDSLGLSFLLAIDCQVVCTPRLLPYVRDLGASVFVQLCDCIGPQRKP